MEKLHQDLKIYSSSVGLKKRVSHNSISKFLNKMNMSHTHFKLYLKKFGWKGRSLTKDVSIYLEPHYTHLELKGGEFPKTIFSEPLSTYQRFENDDILMKYPFPTFNKIESENIDEFDNILPLIYDVEVTQKASFVGLKLYGYEPTICSIQDFKSVIEYLERSFQTKNLILIGYNDVYDANIIILGSKIQNPTAWEFCNLNHQLINSFDKLKHLASFLNDASDKTKKMKQMMTVMSEVNAIRIHSKYNALADEIQGAFFTFDMFSEMFTSSGSLKHHASVLGCKWTSGLNDDVLTYNKEDLENTLHVFLKLGGVDIVKALINLRLSSRSTSRALSKNLLVSEFTKNTFTDKGNFVDKEKCTKKYLFQFRSDIEKKYNYKENLERTIIYGGTTPLKGGDGGVHSMIEGRFIDSPLILDIDYTSFYPNILASEECPLLTEVNRQTLSKLVEERVKLKKTNKPVSDALKVAINSIYGQLAKFNTEKGVKLTDYVTILAKAHILELLRKIEKHAELILDVNTDGVIAKFKTGFDINILHEEFQALKYGIEINEFDYLAYKCVGSYLGRLKDKTYKVKGSWLTDSKYTDIEKGISYNILNIPEILIGFIEKKQFLLPRILKRIKKSDDTRTFQMIDTFDIGLDKDSILTGCSPSSMNKGTDRLSPLGVSEWIIKSKCLLVNYNILF